MQIVGPYLHLGASIKGRKERVQENVKEVTSSWQMKLNFQILSSQVVQVEVDQVLSTYDECVKRGKYDPLNEVFDITKENDEWLCSEDRRLYLQIQSKGSVGSITGKASSCKTVHPSKRKSYFYAKFSNNNSITINNNININKIKQQ